MGLIGRVLERFGYVRKTDGLTAKRAYHFKKTPEQRQQALTERRKARRQKFWTPYRRHKASLMMREKWTTQRVGNRLAKKGDIAQEAVEKILIIGKAHAEENAQVDVSESIPASEVIAQQAV